MKANALFRPQDMGGGDEDDASPFRVRQLFANNVPSFGD
jgi:hypothetical protein